MKRIQVRPGKFVTVSSSLAEKAKRLFASSAFTREEAQRIVALEPRGTTAYLGMVLPVHGTDGADRGAATPQRDVKPSARRKSPSGR